MSRNASIKELSERRVYIIYAKTMKKINNYIIISHNKFKILEDTAPLFYSKVKEMIQPLVLR